MDRLVFTDLDGTLLDHATYSYQAAGPALERMKAQGAPLVLTSSKTRSEMLNLWHALRLSAPFISENGGGVYVPKEHPLAAEPGWRPAGPGWRVIRLGRPIEEVREIFAGFKERFGARGFGDMSEAEVAGLTGLTPAQASLAKKREFNEPVVLPDADKQAEQFTAAATEAGLGVTRGGRFFHLLGGGDKGKAVRMVIALYRAQRHDFLSMGLGDAPNDAPMLLAVDRPVLVARPDGGHAEVDAPGLVKVSLPGPAGFNEAVLAFLE